MLIAADLSPNVQLVGSDLGDFAGAASVSNLQQALTGLYIAAGWTTANPGAVTGIVNPQTVMAVHAVIAELGGKLNSSVKTALQIALPMAMSSTTLMASAKNLIAQYADWLTPAVLGLTAKYTKSAVAPPIPPSPPSAPKPSPYTTATFRTQMQKAVTMSYAKTQAAAAAKLPAGAIQARSKSGMYRIAVPAGLAGQLGGPSLSLGAAFTELPSRTSPALNVQFVSESDLEKKTGTQPFYKKPLVIGLAAGGLAILGGGAFWMTRR